MNTILPVVRYWLAPSVITGLVIISCSSPVPSPDQISAPEATETTASALTSPVILPSYSTSGLPAPGHPGSVARVTDKTMGVWMDTGTQWIPTNGKVVNVMEFGAPCKTQGCGDDAAIQAAINSLGSSGGLVLFPAGYTFTLNTGLNVDRTTSIHFVGSNDSTNAPPALKFTAGSGSAISARGSGGFKLSNLVISYTNTSYAGNLIDFDGAVYGIDTGAPTIDNISITGPANAHALIRLNWSQGVAIRDSHFTGGQTAILGFDPATDGSDNVNGVQIQNCTFNAQSVSAIMNAGQAWLIQENIFEPRADGSAGAYSQTLLNSGYPYAWNVSFIGNWFGDSNANGNWVQIHANGLNFIGNYVYGLATGLFVNAGAQGVNISGNSVGGTTPIVFDAPTSTPGYGYQTGISITGNNFAGAPTPVVGIANIIGGNIAGNFGGDGFTQSQNIVGYVNPNAPSILTLGELTATLPSGHAQPFIGTADGDGQRVDRALVLEARSDIPQGSVVVVTGSTPTERFRGDSAGLVIGQGQGISRHLSATATWAPSSIPNGGQANTTVAVANAAVGDTVAVGFSQPVPGGAILGGAVTAPGTIAVTLINLTGSTLVLPSGTLRADAWQH